MMGEIDQNVSSIHSIHIHVFGRELRTNKISKTHLVWWLDTIYFHVASYSLIFNSISFLLEFSFWYYLNYTHKKEGKEFVCDVTRSFRLPSRRQSSDKFSFPLYNQCKFRIRKSFFLSFHKFFRSCNVFPGPNSKSALVYFCHDYSTYQYSLRKNGITFSLEMRGVRDSINLMIFDSSFFLLSCCWIFFLYLATDVISWLGPAGSYFEWCWWKIWLSALKNFCWCYCCCCYWNRFQLFQNVCQYLKI